MFNQLLIDRRVLSIGGSKYHYYSFLYDKLYKCKMCARYKKNELVDRRVLSISGSKYHYYSLYMISCINVTCVLGIRKMSWYEL